ncbi:MAG TPA: ADOP family duplicated permease [Vicinamibacterales bacterium]|nr:ADOP family duplicated permease [Vicinamibacterales bacterium]
MPERPPTLAEAVFRGLLPIAERDEVLADFRAEYEMRALSTGRGSARRWALMQALFSIPALLRRGWWRGMTGFEPQANRMRPGGPMFESWIMDVRYAARRLMSRPTYALLAVLTLALGAGGTAAIFSVVRTLLLEPLPMANEEQVGVLWFTGSWSEAEFLHLRPNFQGFQSMAAYRPDGATLEVSGGPLRFIPGIATSAELFDVLGTAPMLGRTFKAGDDAPGAEPATVLSYSLWQELGADRSIIGKPVRLGGASRTVVGVMPAGFWFPSPLTRAWNTAPLNPRSRSGRYTLIGRVAPGTTFAQLDGPLRAMGARVQEQFPAPEQWDKSRAPEITPAREFFVGDIRPSLVATFAAMGVILLIACANVAALMLGQIDARSTELAVRAALGANRQRLVQQLVMESIVIGLLAGIVGAALAAVGFGVLVQSLPLGELASTATLDWTIFGASVIAALAAAVIVAIVPGLALWRGSSLQATMATTRTGGIAGRGGRLEGGLVVAQMALAVLLAGGAGLLIRSVANLRAIDPGVDTRGLVLVDATMPSGLVPAQRRRAIIDMIPTLQALPGVKSVAATQKVPLRGSGDNWGIGIRGKPDLPSSTTAFRMVTREYFTTMGMQIRAGRSFDASDREGSDPVVIINEALAAKYFPGEDPIGKVLQTFDERGERIVGVVSNAAEADLTDAPVPARYMLYEHIPQSGNTVTFAVRTDSEERVGALADAVRSTIQRESSQLAIQEMTTLRTVFDMALGAAGQVVTLLTLLAGLALVLGAVGVYGAISHYVTRRARDYGIQIALGQQPGRVISQVVSRGITLVAIGSAIGIAAALVVTRVLASLLYGVEATDPLALGGAVLLLLAVGALAAFLPARRASLLDPVAVLRQ